MDRESLEALFESGAADYEISNKLNGLDGAEAARLLWQVVEAGDHEMAAASRLWYFLRGAEDGVVDAEKFLSLLALHGRLLAENPEMAEREQQSLFSGRPNGNHPFWHRDLDELLEQVLDLDAEALVEGVGEVEGKLSQGKLSQGLGWALARRGLVTAEALSDELVDEVARDITHAGASAGTLEQAARAFASQQERLGRRLAHFGGQRGASTKYALWWPLALEFSTPEQRARWVLNLDGKQPAQDGLAFASERFGDAEVDALVETLVAEKDEPTDYNRPAKRPRGGAVAAILIGRRALQEDRVLEGDEETAFEVGFKPLDGLIAPLAQALGAVDQDRREAFVLAELDKSTSGRWKLVRAIMSPPVLAKLLDEAKSVADDAQKSQSMLRELQSIPLEERGPLVAFISNEATAPAFLQDLTVEVDYVTKDQARALGEETTQYLVDQHFSFHPIVEQTVAVLKSRRALNGRRARARKVTYDKTNLYKPDAKRLFDRESDEAVVVADGDSNSAISAGHKGLPVVTSETFRALLGAPLEDYRRRLLATVRAAREMQELVHLHIGEPASDELIERVESEVLGFAMPGPLKNFYRQMNGFSVYMPMCEDADKLCTDTKAPLPDGFDAYVPWTAFAQRMNPSVVFPDAFERKEQSANPDYYIGVACVLPLEETFFERDWEGIRYGRDDLYCFDAFDSYYDTALRVRPEAEAVDLLVTSDNGAAHHDWYPVGVEAYLEGLLADFFASRLVYKKSGRGSVETTYLAPGLE